MRRPSSCAGARRAAPGLSLYQDDPDELKSRVKRLCAEQHTIQKMQVRAGGGDDGGGGGDDDGGGGGGGGDGGEGNNSGGGDGGGEGNRRRRRRR